ncbi:MULTISPECIES: beta-ketoacyl synthase N-terminal-like domain-containing protein [unclassified Streptomyces]|uniref:beta-ketoacyl synthase N-terminal-like domain-containing protein n=1 Tax=unclassified Streptomyces TaxID=2593676 RepID=UPI003678A29A
MLNGDEVVVTGVGLVTPWPDPGRRLGPGRPGPEDAEWFDAGRELGPRGHKYLPPAARYLLAAGRRALAAAGLPAGAAHGPHPGPVPVPDERRGMVLATNSGLTPLFAAMDRTVVEQGADRLGPATAPYFAVNVLAGRLASEQALRGFGLTLTTPAVGGLEAVLAATRSLAAGRADLVLVCAAEDRPPPGEPGSRYGEEGAVALVLEPRALAERRGAPVLGRCAAVTAYVPSTAADDAPGGTGERRLTDLLRALSPDPGRAPGPLPVHAVLDASRRGRRAARVLERHAGAGVRTVAAGAGCLTPLLRAAALLAPGPGSPDTGGGPHLVVSATATGHLAAARVEAAATDRGRGGGHDAVTTTALPA